MFLSLRNAPDASLISSYWRALLPLEFLIRIASFDTPRHEFYPANRRFVVSISIVFISRFTSYVEAVFRLPIVPTVIDVETDGSLFFLREILYFRSACTDRARIAHLQSNRIDNLARRQTVSTDRNLRERVTLFCIRSPLVRWPATRRHFVTG